MELHTCDALSIINAKDVFAELELLFRKESKQYIKCLTTEWSTISHQPMILYILMFDMRI